MHFGVHGTRGALRDAGCEGALRRLGYSGRMPPALIFDHVGLVVASLEEGRAHLAATLGMSRWASAVDDFGIGVSVQFGVGDTGPAIELIAPLGEGSPVAEALRRGQRLLNHIAYLTPDLQLSAAHFMDQGCVPTGQPQAAVAYGGRPVQFFVSPLRFIVELIEAPGHQHAYGGGV